MNFNTLVHMIAQEWLEIVKRPPASSPDSRIVNNTVNLFEWKIHFIASVKNGNHEASARLERSVSTQTVVRSTMSPNQEQGDF
jgi:hypothetical protein